MTDVRHLMLAMNRGEVTPLLHARVDTQDYQLGVKTCQNFMVSKYGGLTRIPGTLDLNAAEDETAASRLMPFVFNQSQAYALEFSDQKIRFHTVDGVILSGGSPYSITSPYAEADLWDIQINAIGDVVYIACDGYQPRTLTRTSDTSWTLDTYDAEDGPWLPRPSEGTTLSISGGSNTIPIMTSNTAPSGTAASDTSSSTAWQAMTEDPTQRYDHGSAAAGWLSFDFAGSATKTVNAYLLQAPDDPAEAPGMPISWRLEGDTTGSGNWILIDVQTNTSDWLPGETRLFEVANDKACYAYRLRWEAGGSAASSVHTFIGRWGLKVISSEQTPDTITASSVDGINGGNGFQADDVGRLIRMMGDDGFWRVLKITSRTSTTVVSATVESPGPMSKDSFICQVWQLQAWGDEPGWPAVIARHEGRLGFFRTNTQPRGGWLSVVGDFESQQTSQPLLDDDAVSFDLANGQMDEILWGTSNGNDLLLGTVGGIRVIGKRDSGSVFSPSNVQETGSTFVRSGDVEPVWVGQIMIFVNKQAKKLFETAFSYDESGYITRELTMLAEHIFKRGVKELHFQAEPEPTLYAVLNNGQVAVCTYDRQQKVFGVGRLVIPGTSAEVVSMCILPDTDYDVPMLVTKRTVDGAAQYRIEKMLDNYRSDDLSSYDAPVYFAATGRYTGTAASTITGLDHLEGETVGVYDITAGTDLGDATVSSGSISVPGGGTVTDALVGLRMEGEFETLKPPNLPEDGGYLAKPYTIERLWADVYETYGLYGGDRTYTELLRSEDDAANRPDAPSLHTGVLQVPNDGTWSRDQGALFYTNSAYPATVRAIMVDIERGT